MWGFSWYSEAPTSALVQPLLSQPWKPLHFSACSVCKHLSVLLECCGRSLEPVCALYRQPPLEPENACLEALRKLLCPCSDFGLCAVGKVRLVGQGCRTLGAALPACVAEGTLELRVGLSRLFHFASGMLFRLSALRQAEDRWEASSHSYSS